MCVRAYTHVPSTHATGARAEVRGQPVEVGSLLPLCVSQEWNLGCQVWQQVPLSAELSHWLLLSFFIFAICPPMLAYSFTLSPVGNKLSSHFHYLVGDLILVSSYPQSLIPTNFGNYQSASCLWRVVYWVHFA